MENMKKKSPRLAFRIALTIFVSWVRSIISFIRRDIAEFIKFGVTEEIITELETKVNAYEDIATDEELVGNQVIATQAKDAEAKKLREAIGSMMTRAENKFGVNSGYYRKFGITNISDLDGGVLSYAASKVLRVATEFQTPLGEQGLTTVILDDFEALSDSYNLALKGQDDAIANRDIATDNRVEKANEIYHLVVKYCETGKRIWGSVNEAKYNDYIIYDTPSGEPEEGANPV